MRDIFLSSQILFKNISPIIVSIKISGVVLKNEVGERLEIEVGYCSKKCNLARILHSVSAAIFETVE